MMNNKDRLFDKEGRSFAISRNLKGNSIEANGQNSIKKTNSTGNARDQIVFYSRMKYFHGIRMMPKILPLKN